MNPVDVPSSIYRLQLHQGFNFKMATEMLPYLKKLGIDGVYCSPYYVAYSQHGYDITNPNKLNPLIGTKQDFEAFCRMLKELGMKNIIDVVPNHMGIKGGMNAWWQDVLEHGPQSRYANFFDIDWDSEKRALQNKVIFPILGDPYRKCLETGKIRLDFEEGALAFHYFDYVLPLAPKTYALVLQDKMFASVLAKVKRFPTTPAKREALTAQLKQQVHEKVLSAKGLKARVGRRIQWFNSDPKRLHALLEEQYYRISSWKLSGKEINYRRFFNFNDLAAVSIEHEKVLGAHHRLVFELARKGVIQGIRIDHTDGLHDPALYLERVRKKTKLPLFLEKILDPHERLPEEWPVEGNVGYDFLNVITSLYIDKSSEKAITNTYDEFIGKHLDFGDLLYDKKKFFANAYMTCEIDLLGRVLDEVSDLDLRFREFNRADLREAILEVIASFPVYRTYIGPHSKEPSKRDAEYISLAMQRARKRCPYVDPYIFQFIEDLLLLRIDVSKENERAFRAFVLRFQQFTGPIMARGMEDICFYIYNRFLSLNEVGGDPRNFGLSPGEFHQYNEEKRHRWPLSILATSTHDSKRSEDVRMRLNILSELAGEWHEAVFLWKKLNHSFKRRDFPDLNTEYLIYQMLVGLWPEVEPSANEWKKFKERLWNNLLKSIREAREITTWIWPNEKYERSVRQFLFNLLDRTKNRPFFDTFIPFVKKVTQLGYLNSLSSVVLKLGSCGIVDVYQGNESWNFVWVDPDNRRDIDYAAMQEKFAQVTASKEVSLKDLKLYVHYKGLHVRKRDPDLFLRGEYHPIKVEGSEKDRVVAFMRKKGGKVLYVIGGRFFSKGDSFEKTYLYFPTSGTFTDLFTNKNLKIKKGKNALAPIFKKYPFAMLRDCKTIN